MRKGLRQTGPSRMFLHLYGEVIVSAPSFKMVIWSGMAVNESWSPIL